MMTFGPLLRAAAFGLLLLGATAAWSAEEEPLSPPAAGQPAADVFAEAQALIARGAFNEALILLGPLAREGSADEQALFLIGLAAIGASQQGGVSDEGRETLLDAAIASFRTMLVRQPGLVRVRLELARAFFFKGEDDLPALPAGRGGTHHLRHRRRGVGRGRVSGAGGREAAAPRRGIVLSAGV